RMVIGVETRNVDGPAALSPATVQSIVPFAVAGAKMMVSESGLTLACAMASRRLPVAESLRLVTVKVAGTRRCWRGAMRRRGVGGLRGPPGGGGGSLCGT